LPKLLDMAFPLLKRGARGLFLKGQDVGAELTEASKCWNIRYKLVPSRTDDRARIVVVERLESRKTASKPRRTAR
jgi:16S rRNA (guanine527-N7)-methyltransferase